MNDAEVSWIKPYIMVLEQNAEEAESVRRKLIQITAQTAIMPQRRINTALFCIKLRQQHLTQHVPLVCGHNNVNTNNTMQSYKADSIV